MSPDTTTSPEAEALAKAIYDALKGADPTAFMQPFERGENIAIDGYFNLMTVAALLLERLALPSGPPRQT
jgi:hypothetical protein